MLFTSHDRLAAFALGVLVVLTFTTVDASAAMLNPTIGFFNSLGQARIKLTDQPWVIGNLEPPRPVGASLPNADSFSITRTSGSSSMTSMFSHDLAQLDDQTVSGQFAASFNFEPDGADDIAAYSGSAQSRIGVDFTLDTATAFTLEGSSHRAGYPLDRTEIAFTIYKRNSNGEFLTIVYRFQDDIIRNPETAPKTFQHADVLEPGEYRLMGEVSIFGDHFLGLVSSGGQLNYTFALVPEPASLALLGAGGLMLLRRRAA